MTDRYYNGSSDKESSQLESQKPEYGYQQQEAEELVHTKKYLSDPRDAHHSLHRRLSARQVTMIAIGGALGTGLIIGTGQALVHSGPGSILISYSIIGLLCYSVMTALGEMATWLPAAGGFAAYATRVCISLLGVISSSSSHCYSSAIQRLVLH
jgi:amino acid transporter